MKLGQWMCYGIFGALMAAGAVAQGAEPQVTPGKAKKAVTKKTKPAAKKVVKPDVRALQAQREAEARVKAEQEARQRAEAEAKKQAELEAREKPLLDADALIKNGKPADAYALLEPLEFDRSGEVRFDYLLGIAALDSGKPDKATLAFERVLAVDPNFAGARLDMARAYYQLGDLPRARTEFETVLKQNPPEAARVTIQKYLDTIAAQEAAKQTRFTGYVEGTAGHDSNVNTATSQGQVAVPALGNLVFTLNRAGLKSEDYYLGLGGGVSVLHPVNETVALYAGADLRQRGNTVMTQFDSTNLNGNVGGIFALGKQDSLKLGLIDGQYTLGSVRYYDNTGLSGEWRHVFSPANQLSVFGQQAYYRFVDSARFAGMTSQDFDQSILGASWMHVMPDGKSTMFGSLFLGQERDITGLRADGGKRFNGLRVGGQTALNDKTEFFANVGWNEGSYTKQNILFLTTRHDVLYDATMGVNWHWSELWTVRPQLTYSRNDSNIVIYGYDRNDISLTLRRDFK
ncbi:MAG TPA: tetratricopeptide repeat protein [Gallionella sp.]|nr:tetratricopeptide repeat protein [Gallionella sp.]